MDVLPEKSSTSGVTGPVDLIVAYGHRLKLHRVNSKDKLNNAFITNTIDNEKRRSTSKLPRIVKTPTLSNNSFNATNFPSFTHTDNYGDTVAGSSKLTLSSAKTRKLNPRMEPEKLKGSHIPRRKLLNTSVRRENEKVADNNNFYSNKSQHINRLHIPNMSPDFHQEGHMPTTSIGSSRPIPTLGQIYRRNNIIIDGDRFYDWFMELDTPVNSLDSNPRQQGQTTSNESTDTTRSVINVEVNKPYYSSRDRSKVVFGANTNIYKTTNDNVSDWLTGELDFSGRDNESGYRSMSPHSRGAIDVEGKYSDSAVKQSDENYCLTLEKTSEGFENERDNEEPDVYNTEMALKEQPTVVISRMTEESFMEPVCEKISLKKIDIALEPIIICKAEHCQNLQYPSTTTSDSPDEKQLAPSYVDCPSEVLQRTTNFEGDGCDSPNTLSSIAGTDLEIRDDYSSLYELENVDDCNLDDHPGHNRWCPGCRSRSCMTFVKSGETGDIPMQASYCGCHGNKSNGHMAAITSSDNRIKGRWHYCPSCKRTCSRYRDSRVYCKKHCRYRRFPSNRYKQRRPFDSLRKKLSLSRLCRHRWNRVWKKTAARWNNWSKSHSKLGKIRMLEYLEKSVIWEDADAQTMMHVYTEIGTFTNVMEQKSAGISASFKGTISNDKSKSFGAARSFKSRFKQMNLGPSRFPFFNHSKRKSVSMQRVDETTKPIQKFYSYPENQNIQVEPEDFKSIQEKQPLKDTSIMCECVTATAMTSPINLNAQDYCDKEKSIDKIGKVIDAGFDKNKASSKDKCIAKDSTCACYKKGVECGSQTKNKGRPISRGLEFACQAETACTKSSKKSKRSVVCECPIMGDSFNKINKLKTVDTATSGMPRLPLADFNKNNPVVEYTNIERMQSMDGGTGLYPLVYQSGISATSGNITYYKPYEINTVDLVNKSTAKDSINKSAQIIPSTTNAAGSAVNLYSGSSTSSSNQIQTPKKIESLKITKSSSTQNNTKVNHLSIETVQPKLTSTDPKITSISSAQMFPVSVVTSLTDRFKAGPQKEQTHVSTTTTTMLCRCKECRVAITGKSLLQVNKYTDAPPLTFNDKNTGPFNDVKRVNFEQSTSTVSSSLDPKQNEDFGIQALVDQFCKSFAIMTTGTAPDAHSQKSTSVFTAVDQKSACAMTSTKEMQSFNMVTSDASEFQEPKRATTSTNTSYIIERKSIGLSSAAMTTKDDKKSIIDTWVQYSHVDQNDRPTPSARIGLSRLITTRMLNDSTVNTATDPILLPCSRYTSAAIMTSGPIDEASDAMEFDRLIQPSPCTCAQVGYDDIETNTASDFQKKQNTTCSTQVFQSHCDQRIDKATCANEDCLNNHIKTRRNYNKRNTTEPPQSLARLIGQVKSSSHITTCSTQPITNTILSSNLDAAKWIKRCTNNDEKDYQSVIDIEQSALDTLKHASWTIASSNKRNPTKKKFKPSLIKQEPVCDSVAIAAPTPGSTISDDSLADILPAKSVVQKPIPLPPTEIKNMADKVTSDEVLTKPLKESILQTSADIRDAGTDVTLLNTDGQRSASALTSRCILPSPSICCQNDSNAAGCIFIYDKPRCAVHGTRIDASVQMSNKSQEDKASKIVSREHAIDQADTDVFTHLEEPTCERKKECNGIAEVLPPKAYKALYDTTKMVVKDSRRHSVKNGCGCGPQEDEAIIRALAIRSADMLTSKCGLCTQDTKKEAVTTEREYVYAFKSAHASPQGSTQTCAKCHARLLELPTCYQKEVVEECLKSQLVDSCRYYSNLLTKRLEQVKEKVTKHLAPPTQQCMYFATVPKISFTEAITMKPSGREDLGCQTTMSHVSRNRTDLARFSRYRTDISDVSCHGPDFLRPTSCCAFSPSVTNICNANEKHQLKSVYYMLSAIEGRIRRLKRNVPN